MNASADQSVLPFAHGEWREESRGSIGFALAEARLRCAMTIEQVAAKTRVPVRYLTAIEAERFEILPGRVYTRGFVKAFARAVGVCDRWAAEAIATALPDKREAVAA